MIINDNNFTNEGSTCKLTLEDEIYKFNRRVKSKLDIEDS